MQKSVYKTIRIGLTVADVIWIVTDILMFVATGLIFFACMLLPPFLYLFINIIGFKIWKNDSYSLYIGLFMKPGLLFMAFAIVSVCAGDKKFALALTALGIILVSVGIFGIYDVQKKIRLSKEALEKRFFYYGAKYREEALKEYLCESMGLDDVSPKDREQALIHTMMPVAYYFQWLVEKDLLSAATKERLTSHRVELCKRHEINALTLLNENGKKFVYEDVAEECREFTAHYLFANNSRGEADYLEEIKNPEGHKYNVNFSFDVYDRMKDRIDEALEEHNADKNRIDKRKKG